ncbi:hypothetical protein IMZ48_39100 [Candidatus Bathyarchaeota archaeon]|nr:hypothetical protein [Candidatus Bathyarchaeota archaeon]
MAEPPWSRWMSPVGRSMTREGASGDDGDVKVYAPSATWTLMSRYGNNGRLRSAIVEDGGAGRLEVRKRPEIAGCLVVD